MYGSQPCESFYRLLRSLSTIFSTMVNCDLLDSIYKIKKIERLCNIYNKKYEDDEIIFPRKSQFRSSFEQLDKKKYDNSLKDVPNDIPHLGTSPESKIEGEKTLKMIIRKAKLDAYKKIRKLGMIVDINEANNIQVKIKNQNNTNTATVDSYGDCIEINIDDVDEDLDDNQTANISGNDDENMCNIEREDNNSSDEFHQNENENEFSDYDIDIMTVRMTHRTMKIIVHVLMKKS